MQATSLTLQILGLIRFFSLPRPDLASESCTCRNASRLQCFGWDHSIPSDVLGPVVAIYFTPLPFLQHGNGRLQLSHECNGLPLQYFPGKEAERDS